MKMLLSLILLVAIIGGVSYSYKKVWARPEKRACERFVELCREKEDIAECDKDFADLRKVAGPDSIEPAARCVVESQTCGEAVGCVAGGLQQVGAGFFSEMAKGMNKVLKK